MSHLELASTKHGKHLTIVHTPAKGIIPVHASYLESILSPFRLNFHLELRVVGEDLFGVNNDVRVALVEKHELLLSLREVAAEALHDLRLPISGDWNFSPHVTLVAGEETPPLYIFDRLQWVLK